MVSPRKTSSSLSLIPEEHGQMVPTSTKSCESLYSNTSSSKGSTSAMFRRKNPPQNGCCANGNANATGHRQPTLIPAATEVPQRVLSARRLRMKTFQNQLADAQQTIAELAHENRILRTLHKRQDSALAKYESTNAELPKLLHSHAEELRVWQTKYRNLQQQNKELEQKLKQKESIILSLSDQNKYYSQLNKDRNLEERQRLSEKLHQLETRLQEKDNDMKLLARKVQIETKNFRQQILNEQKRTKDVMLKLEKSRLELSGYRKLDELSFSDKFPSIVNRRKPTIMEETKLEQDLEKILEDDDKGDYQPKSATPHTTAADDASYTLGSQRSSRSGTNKLEAHSTRTIRKLNIAAAQLSANRTQRRPDRGDGDAAAMSDFKRNTVRQQKHKSQQRQQKKQRQAQRSPQPQTQPQQQQQHQHQQKEQVQKEVSVEYEEDYEQEPEDLEALIGRNCGGADEDIEDGQEEQEVEGDDHNVTDIVVLEDDDEDDESDEERDIDEMAEGDYTITTAKKSSRMKEDISNIRKQITEDYKEREAFLDTFCRQATSGVLMEETPKKRNNISLNHNLPSTRKNKLLAALKAIDDNKSQD